MHWLNMCHVCQICHSPTHTQSSTLYPPSTHPHTIPHTYTFLHPYPYTNTHTPLSFPSHIISQSQGKKKEREKEREKKRKEKEEKERKREKKRRRKGGEKEEKIAFFDVPLEWIWLILGVQIHLMEYYLLKKFPVKRALFKTRIYIYMFRKLALGMSYVNTMGGRECTNEE